jgi:hypothetical protein
MTPLAAWATTPYYYRRSAQIAFPSLCINYQTYNIISNRIKNSSCSSCYMNSFKELISSGGERIGVAIKESFTTGTQ